MILSRGRKFIFIHIPKTGGTALALALEGRAMKDDILIGDTPKARARKGRLKGIKAAGRLWKHSRICDLPGLASEAEIAEFLVFTVTRNPWDRMVSYYHWLRDQHFAHPAVGLAKTLGFGPFIRHAQTRASLSASPVRSYTCDRTGNDRAALVLRFEELACDTALLGERLGVKLALPKGVNASDRKVDWRGYYTSEDAAVIAEACAEDVERFGYTF